MAKLKPAEGYATVPFHFEDQAARRDREYIIELGRDQHAVLPGTYTHTDYNFEKPGARPAVQVRSGTGRAGRFKGERYRQPGAHLDPGRGEALAAIRREEEQASHKRIRGARHRARPGVGLHFKLTGFPRENQNARVPRAARRLPHRRPGVPRRATDADGETYRADFVVAPTAIPYRPPRITPRPVMRGPQTATVVGPAGEEIFTDKHARVKVQFHWDRLGKRDENSSCFVRVSSTWAGAGWGFIQIPRIGQEVIVDFVEGDPDRPIITGRVYNAAEMPPYGLPGNATQSGWKSNRSPGGGGWNELMFEDKAGSELVNFQAQKDHDAAGQERPHQAGAARPERPHRQRRQALGRGQPRRGRRQQQDDQGRRRPQRRASAPTTPRRVGVQPLAHRRRQRDDRGRRRTRPRRSAPTTPRPSRWSRP